MLHFHQQKPVCSSMTEPYHHSNWVTDWQLKSLRLWGSSWDSGEVALQIISSLGFKRKLFHLLFLLKKVDCIYVVITSADPGRQKSILPPPTITKVWFSSYNYKTGYFTSLNFSNRAFYLPRAVLKTVCYSNHSFVFFFFKKIQLNLWKIIVNHKKS